MIATPRPQGIKDLGSFSLNVEWFKSGARTDFYLDDVEVIRQLMEKQDLRPIRFDSDFTNLVELLEILAPLATPDVDEIRINEISVVIANKVGGGFAFVPFHNENGVQGLGLGMAGSLSGGPMPTDQSEELLGFGDLYRAEAKGDVTNRRTCVGRFSDSEAGLAAAVESSTYFRFNTKGRLICELDDWSHDE